MLQTSMIVLQLLINILRIVGGVLKMNVKVAELFTFPILLMEILFQIFNQINQHIFYRLKTDCYINQSANL